AVALGLIQGPAEVLPVSSSGHLVLVPALLGWPYADLPADVRKAFEVALHTGAGLALAWLLRDDVVAAAADPFGTALLAGPAAAARGSRWRAGGSAAWRRTCVLRSLRERPPRSCPPSPPRPCSGSGAMRSWARTASPSVRSRCVACIGLNGRVADRGAYAEAG